MKPGNLGLIDLTVLIPAELFCEMRRWETCNRPSSFRRGVFYIYNPLYPYRFTLYYLKEETTCFIMQSSVAFS